MALIEQIKIGTTTYDIGVNLANVTGTLAVANGGTGLTTLVTPTVTWTNGTTAGPTLKIKDSLGKSSSAVAIPTASATASGIITTGNQRLRGIKTLEYPHISSNATRYQGFYYVNGADTKVGEHWLDIGDATNITTARYYWRQYSPNSTANTATTGYHETYSLPAVAAGLTANKSYEIFTSKSYSTLDGRYLKLSGGTVTGTLGLRHEATKGTTPSATTGRYIQFLETGSGTAAANRTAMIYNYIDTSNICHCRFYVYKPEASSTSTAYLYIQYGADGTTKAGSSAPFYGAVWNDYAEYRSTVSDAKPGQVVIENGDGTLRLSTERLQPGCEVVSDTFGFAIGETDDCKTPIAATGRVLVYTYEDRNSYLPGDAVCSAPEGKISKMTREEIINYPERIIGTVSEIPSYEYWGSGNVEVDGRIWIRIR